MADETTHTETSAATTDQTAETTAETTAATETTAAETGTEATTETTALGGAGETTETTAAKEGETEGAEAKTDVPETYELAVPEGFEKLDDAAVALATPVFKELGLNNEQANKLVPVAAEFAKKIVADRDQQLMATILDQRKSWLEEAKADPEIGGANWDATLQSAGKALDLLGFPKGSGLRVSLDESGYGNNPEMIRAWAKVGKAIGEDANFPRGDTGGKGKKSDAELFYGPKG